MNKIKNYISSRKLKRKVNDVLETGKAPLIGVLITLADGAKVHTSGKAINLLQSALGENTAAQWHGKYMNEFNELTKRCYGELEELVKKAKEGNR